MIRVIIVDDERLARSNLRRRLGEFPEVMVIGEAQNADEAQEFIEAEQPDVVFLDVQMPGKTGFELLERLDSTPQVIFTTAYDEYALKAFEVNALDYLLKPIDPVRLAAALAKVSIEPRHHNQNGEPLRSIDYLNPTERVFVRDGDRCWFVQIKDIRLFESEGSYARLYFDGHKPLIFRSLNHLEERLHPAQFFRASRQHIVNLEYVESIEPRLDGGLTMHVAGTPVSVSRRQAQRFKESNTL